jgi:hypothetical protein
MKITIDSEVIEKDNISIEEFSVLLYYLVGGTGTLNDVICNILWEKNFLIKTEDGYIINNNMLSTIEQWISLSSLSDNKKHHLLELAQRMMDLYPTGKKPGTNYYWRDSKQVISQRLAIFIKKYGDNYTDDEIVEATRRYVESFHGDYTLMRLLKYFISKKDSDTKEDSSELLAYLSNTEDTSPTDNWLNEMR